MSWKIRWLCSYQISVSRALDMFSQIKSGFFAKVGPFNLFTFSLPLEFTSFQYFPFHCINEMLFLVKRNSNNNKWKCNSMEFIHSCRFYLSTCRRSFFSLRYWEFIRLMVARETVIWSFILFTSLYRSCILLGVDRQNWRSLNINWHLGALMQATQVLLHSHPSILLVQPWQLQYAHIFLLYRLSELIYIS